MANAILAFPNRADEATLSGGSWATGLPLNNLKNRIISKVARSTDDALGSTKFDAALTKDRPVRVLALVNHNLSLGAKYRIRGSLVNDFATTVVDTGWQDVWPVLYPAAALEWEDDNWWTGRPIAEEIAGYTWSLIHIFDSAHIARYWRIEIDDTDNAAGYVQIGRLFLASQWQVTTNITWGAQLGYQPRTLVDEAIGGAEYFDRRPAPRVARVALDWMSVDEAMSRALELQRQAGIDAEVLFVYDPQDTAHKLRRSFLARLRSLNPIEHASYDRMTTAFDLKELL